MELLWVFFCVGVWCGDCGIVCVFFGGGGFWTWSRLQIGPLDIFGNKAATFGVYESQYWWNQGLVALIQGQIYNPLDDWGGRIFGNVCCWWFLSLIVDPNFLGDWRSNSSPRSEGMTSERGITFDGTNLAPPEDVLYKNLATNVIIYTILSTAWVLSRISACHPTHPCHNPGTSDRRSSSSNACKWSRNFRGVTRHSDPGRFVPRRGMVFFRYWKHGGWGWGCSFRPALSVGLQVGDTKQILPHTRWAPKTQL